MGGHVWKLENWEIRVSLFVVSGPEVYRMWACGCAENLDREKRSSHFPLFGFWKMENSFSNGGNRSSKGGKHFLLKGREATYSFLFFTFFFLFSHSFFRFHFNYSFSLWLLCKEPNKVKYNKIVCSLGKWFSRKFCVSFLAIIEGVLCSTK